MTQKVQDALDDLFDDSSDEDSEDNNTVNDLQRRLESQVDSLPSSKKEMGWKVLQSFKNMKSGELFRKKARKRGIAYREKYNEIVLNGESVDLCFCVDTTASMGPSIRAVKKYIRNIITGMKQKFKKFNCRVGFVSYKDWEYRSLDGGQFQTFDFSEDISEFLTFMKGMKATSAPGNDFHENGLWGIQKALDLSWERNVKLIIHICDCPPHGLQFGCFGDNDPFLNKHQYPNCLDLFTAMAESRSSPIHYFMVDVCQAYLEETKTEFKRCYEKAKGLTGVLDQEWLFNTTNLSDPIEIVEIAMNSISSSIVSSSTRTIFCPGGNPRKRRKIDRVEVDKTKHKDIKWDQLPAQKVNIDMYLPPMSIKESIFLSTGVRIETNPGDCNVKIASKPFNQGSERIVYHGKQWLTGKGKKRVVLKKPKGEIDNGALVSACEKNAIVTSFARTFNDELQAAKMKGVKLRTVDVWFVNANPEKYTMEPYVKGKFIKINNNAGRSLESGNLKDVGQAFSFFTYVRSGYKCLVCDIQGWAIEQADKPDFVTLVLTDPAIHNLGNPGTYGRTDMGTSGINAFLKGYEDEYKDNPYHEALNLGNVHPHEEVD